MSISAEQIQNAFNEFQKAHNNNLPIKLVISERYENESNRQIADEDRVRGLYSPRSGEIKLFTSALRDHREVVSTIRHELLGHYGINTLTPDEKRDLLNRIIESRNEPTLTPIWQAVDRVYEDRHEQYKAEEVFAAVAEIVQSRIIPPRTQLTDWVIQPSDNHPLDVFELRTIAEAIDNGITAGIRKQQTFPKDDQSQFKASADLSIPKHPNNPTRRLTREEQVKVDFENQQKAAFIAKEVIREALPVLAGHPYLQRKKIMHDVHTWNSTVSTDSLNVGSLNLYELDASKLKSIIGYAPKSSKSGEYLKGRILIAPVGDANGLTTLEFIDEKGLKSALAGGRKSGAYYEPDFVNHKAREIYIVEGVATALSIREALKDRKGVFVVAALSSNNLKKTALDMQEITLGEVPITVCAEIGNGHMQAKKAAAELNWEAYKQHKDVNRAINYIAHPLFHPHQRMPDSSVPTDFNDLWQLRPYSVLIDLNNRKHLQITQNTADKEVGEIVVGILRNEALIRPSSSLRLFLREVEQLDYKLIGHGLLNNQGLFTNDNLAKHDSVIHDLRSFMTESVQLEINYRFDYPSVEGRQGSTVNSTRTVNDRSYKMTSEASKASSETPEKVKITDNLKMNAAVIFGQGLHIYPPKAGGVYKGDIAMVDNYALQNVGNNTIIAHDKSKLSYVSGEFQQVVEKLNRPEVAVYYQDKDKKPAETATIFPFSRAKDDMDRVIGGLKKSVKELGDEVKKELKIPANIEKILDKLGERTWERSKEIRQEIKQEKEAAREAAKDNQSKSKSKPKR